MEAIILGNSNLNILLKEYEKKKYQAELNFEKQREAFNSSNPELLSLNSKLGKLALDISRAALSNNSTLESKLKDEFNELKLKKNELLNSINDPKGAIEPLYDCSICKDTGFVTDENGRSILCNCIKQKLFDLEFNKSNIRKLG